MKIRIILILLGLMAVFTQCSMQSKLTREYKGRTQEELMVRMGRPKSIENISGGRKISIYEKTKYLKPASINTGQFQYDKFESPRALKTEIYKFYINAQGRVEEVKYDVSYER